MRIDELDTPVLVINLDALEENLKRYHGYFERHGIGFRPHIKTHKTLAVAHMQLKHGAIGLTCQKLGEAEVLAAGGIHTDLLIPYNIMGARKLDRLTALAKRLPITLAPDSEFTVRGLSRAAASEGVSIGILIEVEMGFERTGVPTPREAAELAKLVHDLPGLELRGFMGFPTPPDSRPLIQETIDLFDRAGLPRGVVSGGGTPHALDAHKIPELTEYRAGEYPVGGAMHLAEGRHTVDQCALRVITTVVSRPTGGPHVPGCGKQVVERIHLQDGTGGQHGTYRRIPRRAHRSRVRRARPRGHLPMRGQTGDRRARAGASRSPLSVRQRTRRHGRHPQRNGRSDVAGTRARSDPLNGVSVNPKKDNRKTGLKSARIREYE